MADLQDFQSILGHEFQTFRLAEEVLTHSSLLNEPAGAGRTDNRRLAHVGDAVVELAVRTALYRRFPGADRQELSERADVMVTDKALADVARQMGLGRFLVRGGSRPRAEDNETVLAELFEAAMGAVFFDSNFGEAEKVIARHLPGLRP